MKTRYLHSRNMDFAAARAVQERLRHRVSLVPLSLGRIRFVAGSDIAISKKLDRLVAAVVILTFPDLDVVETRTAVGAPAFPYVPGYLSFRELPVLIECFEKVQTPFQVLLCDGQGIAHPRGFGLASHAGLALGVPAVGCAKSRLVGEHADVGEKRGDYVRLLYRNRQVGSVVRTRDGVKPVYVSPGHLADHAGSRRVVLASVKRYRLPEPTRLAHIAAGNEKRKRESLQPGNRS